MLTTTKRLLCMLIGHESGPDCSRCLTFVCAKCRRRVSWDFGGDGDECDDCWAERHSQTPLAPS